MHVYIKVDEHLTIQRNTSAFLCIILRYREEVIRRICLHRVLLEQTMLLADHLQIHLLYVLRSFSRPT
ncbi:hypothetical protein L1887_16558 [Cichorium endivia]|nr:hypothetical protein L1887_16558 [Cichorium endivia]